LGALGVVLLVIALWSAGQQGEMLRAWPRVNAHVSAGGVVSRSTPERREAMYAMRLQLRYSFDGREYFVPATERVFSSNYAAQARDARQAVRETQVTVLLDPTAPGAPVLNAGPSAEFFLTSLILGSMGACCMLLAAVCRRMFRDEQPGAAKNKGGGNGARWVAAFFAVLGVGFLVGGGSLFWASQWEATAWKSVAARVDSTDVVWRTSSSSGSGANSRSRVDLYAARAWITYRFQDSSYHVPVIRGSYSNDSSQAAEVAAGIGRSGHLDARLDPNDPFDAALDRPGAVSQYWMPALFIVPGLVCLWLAWLFGANKKGRRRSRCHPKNDSPASRARPPAVRSP
jgi:hypothetical protein